MIAEVIKTCVKRKLLEITGAQRMVSGGTTRYRNRTSYTAGIPILS